MGKKSRKLFLGGLLISKKNGLVGHSDADVLIHSICDAILGALNVGDIGEHFSDKDPKNKNKKSSVFLKKHLKASPGPNHCQTTSETFKLLIQLILSCHPH